MSRRGAIPGRFEWLGCNPVWAATVGNTGLCRWGWKHTPKWWACRINDPLTTAPSCPHNALCLVASPLRRPFKDTASHPEPVQGWSPERSMRLGAAMLTAVNEVLPQLR